MNSENAKILLETCCFAAEKHRDQRRKDAASTPYINHPLGVALILTEAGVTDIPILQAAILHDTVEDTDTSFEEIQVKFGTEVMKLVKEVTDDKDLSKAERKRLQVVNAPHKSKGAQLIKQADKIYNLRDIQRGRPADWTAERAEEYFLWAKSVTDGCMPAGNTILQKMLQDIYQEGPIIK